MPETQAERLAKQTLHGEWRTPMPINFVDDDEKTDGDGKRYYRGAVRDQVRMSVQKIVKKVGDVDKVERHITLSYYGRNDETDKADLDDLKYVIEGKANPKYDRIKWENGCVWTRHGATQRERDAEKHGFVKVLAEDGAKGAPPPDFDSLAASGKRFQPSARHTAAAPDWDSQVKEIQRVMMDQMKEVDARVEEAMRQKAQKAASQGQQDCEAMGRTPFRLSPQQAHGAPPPAEGEDTEGAAPTGKVLVADGEHKMMCCTGLCGKGAVEEVSAEAQPEEPLPEARDMEKEGFFAPDELEDVIDRINDVVGIWGVSEETEREYIKPPVEAMNKLIAAAMSTFMNNPLMDLISYLMDGAMEFAHKCAKIGHYINEHFVKPLCDALVDGLEEMFAGISWIKDQVKKVIMMMSQMVTDQVVSKSVEQIGDSDAVD